MTANHGCRFDWCVNDCGIHEVNRLEHFSGGTPIPATGVTMGRDELPLVRIYQRFNEDLDPAPMVTVNISGGRPYRETEVDLQAAEAILLYNDLGRAIKGIIAGTNINPARIVEFYAADAAAE